MISAHGFVGFIAAVGGFIGGVMWVDASASLELTRTRNEVAQLQKQLKANNETIDKLKTASIKRQDMVKDFTKNYLEVSK